MGRFRLLDVRVLYAGFGLEGLPSASHQVSDITHKLSPTILEHQQATIIYSAEFDLGTRSFDQKQEDESNGLACRERAWLMITSESLLHTSEWVDTCTAPRALDDAVLEEGTSQNAQRAALPQHFIDFENTLEVCDLHLGASFQLTRAERRLLRLSGRRKELF